jgi:murein DD-endopeptidase MepM/ murein hydrolase activator NlpD
MFKFLALFLFSSSIFAAAYEGDSGGIFALPVSNEYKSNEYLLFQIDGGSYVIAGMPYVSEEKVIEIDDKKIKVLPVDYGESRITIANDSLVNPSPSDQERAAKERKSLQSVLTKESSLTLDDLKFLRPVKGAVTSGYGKKRFINDLPRAPHLALDLDGFDGDPIVAPLDAKVVLVDDFFYSGKIIVLDHGSNVFTSYSHMSKSHREVGDFVKKGDLIGEIGSTGRVTGPHLHWVVYINGNRINPEIVLNKDFPKNLFADYQDVPADLPQSEE